MTKKYYIETYGCQMNVADSEVVASILGDAGYEPVVDIKLADIIDNNEAGDPRRLKGAQVGQISFDDFAGKWVRFQPTLTRNRLHDRVRTSLQTLPRRSALNIQARRLLPQCRKPVGLKADPQDVARGCGSGFSNRVACQAWNGCWSRTIALRMRSSLCMHATMATFFTFPAAKSLR